MKLVMVVWTELYIFGYIVYIKRKQNLYALQGSMYPCIGVQ